MRWLQTEYIAKGIYLGLLLFVALRAPDWNALGYVALCTLAGLLLALAIAGVRKLLQGYRVRGHLLAFLLFLLLESPGLIYAGVLLGTAAGAFAFIPPPAAATPLEGATAAAPSFSVNGELLAFAGGGAILGILFGALRTVQQRTTRIGLSLALAVALVGGALVLFGQLTELGPQFQVPGWTPPTINPPLFGAQLLIGIPIFYLLTFVGKEEESEIEIGAMCAALGLGIWMFSASLPNLGVFRSAGFVVPLFVYIVYTTRILPGLRVFKHVLRGLNYLQMARFRPALLSLRRALQLDPRNRFALDGLWLVHRTIDVEHLPDDPQLLALLDLDLCLDRAGGLLLEGRPTPARLQEAHRLLDLVENQRPAMTPRTLYWRSVAFTHSQQYDRAAEALTRLLDPAHWEPNDPQRQVVVLPAWQLALTLHQELRRLVGVPQVNQPGRRMEAILAVERHLAAQPQDKAIWTLKQVLYQDLTEAEYSAAAGADGVAVPHFDHAYAQQLGLALIDDPVRWQRGGEYLRIAARGMPTTGPAIFIRIAQAHERAGNSEGVWHNYELAKRAGRSVGPKNLTDEDRQAYFATVKALGENAVALGDLDGAIENYLLYSESERSGIETLRALADLFERKGDPLQALRVTEQALVYNARDRDLVERKDRYYYSVLPEDLRARLDLVRGGFDVAYCIRKARTLLDAKNADLDVIDWAQHLAGLVRVVQPENMTARLLVARALLRRGEVAEAVNLLEETRNPAPEKFAGEDDETSWFLSCRTLGDLYLNELGKPEQALACYIDFRKSSRSGADTLYKMGQAYEQLGDMPRAKRCYEQVTAYENHPLVHEARDALYRLQAS